MRDCIITNRLRYANKFPLIFAKTNEFKKIVYLPRTFTLSVNCVRDTLDYFRENIQVSRKIVGIFLLFESYLSMSYRLYVSVCQSLFLGLSDPCCFLHSW